MNICGFGSIVRQDNHYGSEGQGFEFSAARQNDTAFCGVVFLLFHINTYI